ncbi:glycosyltransferase family 2 protein [Proteinivorax hydrogeniformans]|uniref:Glucosyl-3-phosphoglycerate synthase n=1 Tax=Proteinivorax hydrogeniformans TaxID=1826727 RepID=A0AAU8HPY3_9FIRM
MSATCIIPAYNEEKTIGNVVKVVKGNKNVSEVIVVSDGSTDKTAQVAKNNGARVIELTENKGKGGAMNEGLKSCGADIILFLDADLIGLTDTHVESLLSPVLRGDTLMTLGVFSQGRATTDLAQKVAPYLSGQRAIKRELLHKVSDLDVSRFGVELALTRFVENNKINLQVVQLPDMSHVMKEEKLGVLKGFVARMKMYWEIVHYYIKNPS